MEDPDSNITRLRRDPQRDRDREIKRETVYLRDDEVRSEGVQEEILHDGGRVPSGPPDVSVEPRREKTRGKLAIALCVLLGGIAVLHYCMTAALVFIGKAEAKSLETAFTAAISPISVLVGAAVAFYFKER